MFEHIHLCRLDVSLKIKSLDFAITVDLVKRRLFNSLVRAESTSSGVRSKDREIWTLKS